MHSRVYLSRQPLRKHNARNFATTLSNDAFLYILKLLPFTTRARESISTIVTPVRIHIPRLIAPLALHHHHTLFIILLVSKAMVLLFFCSLSQPRKFLLSHALLRDVMGDGL